ncbi:MAG: hypothetical protein ACNA7W_19555 [Pseudomonadales bacterium]
MHLRHGRALAWASALTSALALATAWPAAAAAEQGFELHAGATFFDADAGFTSLRADRPAVGFDLDQLGIERGSGRFFASLSWYLTERWVLQLDTFGFDNDGGRPGELAVDLGGRTITTDVALDGWLEVDLYALNVGYRLHQAGGFELGAGVGVHYVDLDYGLAATLAGDPPGTEVLSTRSTDRFPAPNLYGWAGYRFNERLRVGLKAGWLDVDYDDLDGRIAFVRSSVQYDFSRRFGIGAGYWVTDFDVDRQRGNRFDSYDVRLHGPQLYLKTAF